MTTRPDKFEWVSGDDADKITDPPQAKKDTGWIYKEKVAFQYWNWVYNLIAKWIDYFDSNNNPFMPQESSTPDLNVVVGAGKYISSKLFNTTADQDVLFVAPSVNPRIDRIYLNRLTGIPGIRPGTEAASPVAPDYKIGDIPICQVALATTTTEITNDLITDERAVVIDSGEDDLIQRILVANWTERENPKDVYLNDICWNEDLGLFCAVGLSDGADSYIITSSTGFLWTEQANPALVGLYDVVWSPGLNLFCAVGDDDTTDAYIITSPDGATWTERSNPKAYLLNGISWSPELSLFVACGNYDGVDAYLLTSSNGITWIEQTNPAASVAARKVAWSPELNLFVICGNSGLIMTSPDGTNWTSQTTPVSTSLYDITWNPSIALFCAVGLADGTDAGIITSPDGINWTERANPEDTDLRAVSNNGAYFVAAGIAFSGTNYIVTSPDGITWTRQLGVNIQSIDGMTFGKGIFVGVGLNDGTDGNIMTSMLN